MKKKSFLKSISFAMLALIIVYQIGIISGIRIFRPVLAQAAGTLIATTTYGNSILSTSTFTEISVGWTVGMQTGGNPVIASGSTAVVKIKDSAGALVAQTPVACTASTTAIAGGNINPVFTGGTATFTFTSTSTVVASTTASACLRFASGFTAGTYYATLVTGANAFDALAVPLYAGATNNLIVTADVEPSFTFTMSGNSCNLGVLNGLSTSTCTYSATSTSNSSLSANNAISIKASSTNLSYSGTNVPAVSGWNGTLSGGNCGINGTANGAQGIIVTPYTNTNRGSNYNNANINAISQFNGTEIANSGATNAVAFAITHVACAGNNLKVGHYTQTVTYSATLSF